MLFSRFLDDQRGAITMDWVTITAGLALLGVAVVFAVYGNGLYQPVDRVNKGLKDYDADMAFGHVPEEWRGGSNGSGTAAQDLNDFENVPVRRAGQDWAPEGGYSTTAGGQ